MTLLLHELPLAARDGAPDSVALVDGKRSMSYAALAAAIDAFAAGLIRAGIRKHDRIAVYLPKTLEAVIAFFGAARAGAVFVPVNSLLKPGQVVHILGDCDARCLVSTGTRLATLTDHLDGLAALQDIILTDKMPVDTAGRNGHLWQDFCQSGRVAGHRVIDVDLVSILYTSGSTGRPKGVMLSHRNMVTGALSVASYLENTADDRLLAVLPFSFDYGFSQLSTAFSVGAKVVLLEYLLPRDVVRKLVSEKITGLAGVPPLWNQLAALAWPPGSADSLRYFTNTGGAMPKATLRTLREKAPGASPYLMYGLTEAFRSTYLPPSEVDRRPESMGKAIPNADIVVVDKDGKPCAAGETGELVHRGSLVSMGYWNNAEKTAERFKPFPDPTGGGVLDEIAVWSGDSVRSDEDGFLYFVARRDEMIKTSGYRVSPAEIEEVLYDAGIVEDVVAFGAAHADLGQGIVVVASARQGIEDPNAALLKACRDQLANFMQPRHVEWLDALPRNPNGKIDRASLSSRFCAVFSSKKQDA